MLKKLKEMRRKSDQQGFTIIEVLIVLAIAGLIMVVVFLAVPNLQKSQRNNGRKTDANNAMSALSDYISNNGGQLPASCANGTACTFIGAAFKTSQFDPANISYVNVAAGGTLPTTVAQDKMILLGGVTCSNGAAGIPATGQSRQVAVYYYIEGSVSSQCISQ